MLAYFPLTSIPEVEYEESYLTLWVGKTGYKVSYPAERYASIAYEWLADKCRIAAEVIEDKGSRNPALYSYGEDEYTMMDMVERFMNLTDNVYFTERLER